MCSCLYIEDELKNSEAWAKRSRWDQTGGWGEKAWERDKSEAVKRRLTEISAERNKQCSEYEFPLEISATIFWYMQKRREKIKCLVSAHYHSLLCKHACIWNTVTLELNRIELNRKESNVCSSDFLIGLRCAVVIRRIPPKKSVTDAADTYKNDLQYVCCSQCKCDIRWNWNDITINLFWFISCEQSAIDIC